MGASWAGIGEGRFYARAGPVSLTLALALAIGIAIALGAKAPGVGPRHSPTLHS
ncbi:MAG TPA: hypothetical protein VFG12_15195 [Rhodopila sp.]|nr:hypothetical protein [Rhodopila sp.]